MDFSAKSATDRLSMFIDRLNEASDSVHEMCMLRASFPDRFRQLVCTHLAHLIDVPADFFFQTEQGSKEGLDRGRGAERRRRSPFRRRSADRTRERSSSRERDQWKRSRDMAEKISKLIDYLLRDPANYCIEGIFRLSGNKSRQRQLDVLFHSHSALTFVDLTSHCPIDLACTLKKLLQDRTQPLLTSSLAPFFFQLGRPLAPSQGSLEARLVIAKRLKAARLLIQLLPKQNRTILSRLLVLVGHIASSPKTRMSTEALARLLGPCLLAESDWSPDRLKQSLPEMEAASKLLFDNANDLYRVPVSFLRDVTLNLAIARRKLPRDAESDSEFSITEDEVDSDDEDLVVTNIRFCSSPRRKDEIAIESLTNLADHVQKVVASPDPQLSRRAEIVKVVRRASSGSGRRISDLFKSMVAEKQDTKSVEKTPTHSLPWANVSNSLSTPRACPRLGGPLCTRSVQDLGQTPKKGFGLGFRFMKATPVKSEVQLKYNSITPLKALPLH